MDRRRVGALAVAIGLTTGTAAIAFLATAGLTDPGAQRPHVGELNPVRASSPATALGSDPAPAAPPAPPAGPSVAPAVPSAPQAAVRAGSGGPSDDRGYEDEGHEDDDSTEDEDHEDESEEEDDD